MAQSRLKCSWVFDLPVHIDDSDDTLILLSDVRGGWSGYDGDLAPRTAVGRESGGDDGAGDLESGQTAVLSSPTAVRRRGRSSRFAHDLNQRGTPRRDAQASSASGPIPYSEDELCNFYTTELMAAVGPTAQTSATVNVQGTCVNGANGLVVIELHVPVVTWTNYGHGVVLAFCSCGGVMGGDRSASSGTEVEHPEIQHAMGCSSTCLHARALLRAYDSLAQEIKASCVYDLILAFPILLGPSIRDGDDNGATSEVVTCFVTHAERRRNVPIYAVGYGVMWTAVGVRPTSNKYKLATCLEFSCKSRPWGCIHAKAVNKFTRVDASSEAARAEKARHDTLPVGSDEVFNQAQEEEPLTAVPPADSQPAAEMPISAAEKPSRPQRSRNMFPCATEVKLCQEFSSAVDALRSSRECPQLERTLVESTCSVCGESGRGRAMKLRNADVITMRGRLIATVGNWVCPNGHLVEYDGAEDGLFAAGPETLYVRVFLDCIHTLRIYILEPFHLN